MTLYTRNGTDRRQNVSPTNLLTPYGEQPDRLGLLSFANGQRFQQKEGGQITLQLVLITIPDFLKIASCRGKENCSAEVRGGGGLALVKLARDSASNRPKLCASLKIVRGILPGHHSLLAVAGRKQTVVRDQLSFRKVVRAFEFHAQTRLQHLDNRASLRPSRIWCLFVQSSVPRYPCACCGTRPSFLRQ